MQVTKAKAKGSWMGNLLLLLATILVSLIAAEVLLRVTGLQVGNPDPQVMAFDDTLGWVFEPNSKFQLIRGKDQLELDINRWGFRDDQPPPAQQAAAKTRIMLLGDSYAEGHEIRAKERASEYLEQADTNMVVYNFGIGGYSTDQELLVLKKFGPEVRPHVVLLFFCVNDIYYNAQAIAGRQAKPLFKLEPDGSLKPVNLPLPPPHRTSPIIRWVTSRVAIAKVTSNAIGRITEGFERKTAQALARETGRAKLVERGAKEDKLLWLVRSDISNLTYYLLRDIRDECCRLGAQLIVFMCPSSESYTATRDDSPEGIKLPMDWCTALEIPAVDLFPVFRRYYLETGKNLYIYDKMHWNAQGNRIVADAVMETMQKLGLRR